MYELSQIHEITMLHWLLAYAGSFIYIMLKIQELSEIKGYQFGAYVKSHLASTVATIVMIPVCMLILHDSFNSTLPINNLTSVIIGYQTNQIFKSIMSIGKKKFNTPSDEQPPQNP